MKIGNIDLGTRPLFLAPMEDVTDIGFRMLCKRFGAAMVYTEFVSAEAIIRSIRSTLNKMVLHDEERPVGIQIYGRDTASMVEAAKIVEEAKPDVIDINFGCPVKKVAGKGAGAGMLRNVPLMLEITRAVVNAVSIPVTAKTRLGWDHDSIIIEQLAEQLQDCGISALTIHGRTRSQVYNGEADWEPIRRVKANPRINIPIIGNGDITSGEEARRRFEETGVDAVMVGRATFGKPWIFAEINRALGKEPEFPLRGVIDSVHEPLSLDWKLDVLMNEVRQSVKRNGSVGGLIHMRRHIAASPLFKGIPDFRATRIAMLRSENIDEMLELMEGTRPLLELGNENIKP